LSGDPEPTREAREAAADVFADLETAIAPLASEAAQLARHSFVARAEVVANGYDLSPGLYRRLRTKDPFIEDPQVTLTRLQQLDDMMSGLVAELAATS
jgi:hypothetical protein